MKIIITVLAFISLLILGCIVYFIVSSRPYDIQGPQSPVGYTVVAHVSDCGLTWCADFYTDIEVLNPNGKVVSRWRDTDGQYPKGGPEKLVESMKWIDPITLEFYSDGKYRITLQIQQ